MLAVTGICIYIFALSFIYGIFSVRLINLLFNLKEDEPLPFTIITALGLTFVSVVASLLSIFLKTSLVTSLVLFIGALLYLALDFSFVNSELRKRFSKIKLLSLPSLVFFVMLLGYFFTISEMASTNYDTSLYHAHLVKWHENYAAVPGLGNLHDRLATNSSWFVLAAVFSFSFLDIMSFNVMSHFLLLLIIFYTLGGVNNLFRGNLKASNWIRVSLIPVFLYSYFYPHLGWAATPSPDVPTVIFTWIFFAFAMQTIEKKGSFGINTWTLSLVIISAFTMTIKLSGAMLVIFTFLLLFRELSKKQFRNLIIIIIVTAVILLPFLVRNIIFSGYLLHPFPAIDLFSFDWKIPPEAAAHTKKVIEDWAKFPAWFRNVPEGAALDNMSFSQWYEVWLANQTFPFLKEILNIIYMFSAVYLAGFLTYIGGAAAKIKLFKNHYENNKNTILSYAAVFLVGAAAFAFWLTSAPDLRFGWGVLFAFSGMFVFLTLQIFFNFIGKAVHLKISPHLQTGIYLVFSAAAIYFFLNFYGDMKDLIEQRKLSQGKPAFWDTFYLPPDYSVGNLKVQQVNGYEVYYSGLTGYSPIPSNSLKTSVNVYMRGNTFQQGFKIIEKNENEPKEKK